MRRAYKRLLTFLISLMVVLLSGVAGYGVARQEPRIVDAKPTPTAVEAGANNDRIAAGASITWVYDYDMCRHTETVETTADKDFVGLSFTQFQQKYPGFRIVSFDADAVVIKKELLCYCPQHLVLKKDGDIISVYRTKSGSDEQEKLRDFGVDIMGIDPDEQKALETGRVFSDMSEIERYISGLLQD